MPTSNWEKSLEYCNNNLVICDYYDVWMAFASLRTLIISWTPIINIQIRPPSSPLLHAHLHVSGVPGTLFPGVYHLLTLGSLYPPPTCSWASTCGQREDAPDMQIRSLRSEANNFLNDTIAALNWAQRRWANSLLTFPPRSPSSTRPHWTGIRPTRKG